MKNRYLLFTTGILASLILFGCSGDETVSNEKEQPAIINESFVMYQETDQIDYDSIGSIYFKSEDNELVSKIADEVRSSSAVYNNRNENIMYIDSNDKLYNYSSSEEPPVEIGNDVRGMYYTDSDDIVYFDNNGSVYVYNHEKTEKIGSNLMRLEVLQDEVFYTTQDENLISYNIVTREEKLIGDDVFEFNLLDNSEDFIFTDNNYNLFYQESLDGQAVRISSGRVDLVDVNKVNNKLYYLETGSDQITNLYSASIDGKTRPELLTNNVWEYDFNGKELIYLTDDNSLYRLDGDNVSTRIATGVLQYDFASDGIVYLEEDYSLYKWNAKENSETVIGRDVESFEALSNGRVFYMTEYQDLYEDNIKMATDLSNYTVYHDTLIYAVENELYSIKEEEPELVIDDLDTYSAIFYQNDLVYENRMKLDDTAGVWEFETSTEDKEFIKIDSDGLMTNLATGAESYLEETHRGFRELEVLDNYNDSMIFTINDSNMSLSFDNDSYPLKISTEKLATEYFDELEERAEREREKQEELTRIEEIKSEASYTVSEFIYYLPQAINYGSFSYISEYIDSSSGFYDSQSEFIYELYQSNISENLLDYTIKDVKVNSDGTVTVITKEAFEVFNYDSYEEKLVEYEAVYTLVNNNYSYQIVDLDIK